MGGDYGIYHHRTGKTAEKWNPNPPDQRLITGIYSNSRLIVFYSTMKKETLCCYQWNPFLC